MLSPKKVKWRKQQKGRMRGLAKGGNKVDFGDWALQAVECGWLTARQIEAARVAINREIKRGGKLYVRIFPFCCFRHLTFFGASISKRPFP